jgi:transcriptional regulator with XRE-family HTH domain
MSNPDWLARAAQRSREETWMLGHAFERYRELEGCSQDELARQLGCTRDALRWLSLCRRPEGERFAEHVTAIASRFGLEVGPLVQVLRRVEVLGRLPDQAAADAAQEPSRTLMAAKDRSDDDETGL